MGARAKGVTNITFQGSDALAARIKATHEALGMTRSMFLRSICLQWFRDHEGRQVTFASVATEDVLREGLSRRGGGLVPNTVAADGRGAALPPMRPGRPGRPKRTVVGGDPFS